MLNIVPIRITMLAKSSDGTCQYRRGFPKFSRRPESSQALPERMHPPPHSVTCLANLSIYLDTPWSLQSRHWVFQHPPAISVFVVVPEHRCLPWVLKTACYSAEHSLCLTAPAASKLAVRQSHPLDSQSLKSQAEANEAERHDFSRNTRINGSKSSQVSGWKVMRIVYNI